MKFIKDFIYDKNDIVIAFLILLVAGALIVWRMDAIMTYPQTLAEKTGPTKTVVDEVDTDADADSSSDADSNAQSSDGVWSGNALAAEVKVTIEPGVASVAVQSLVDAGLFESYEDFEQVCKSIGREPTNIKATSFTFGPGSTKADIAKTVTN
ncbi:MAG: hypothetical protein MR328_03255 [Firmicutes bacterium]|nr:hypothetical protein [Bacillota bacterium]